MKRFITSLSAFISGLPWVTGSAATTDTVGLRTPTVDFPEPVSLRPLNLPGDNLYAAHRSHSSHSSHRSHRSSSGGGSSYRAPSSSSSSPPSKFRGSGSSSPTDPGRSSLVSPTPTNTQPRLNDAEKRKLQILRVQLELTKLGLFSGAIDGVLGPETRDALKLFQKIKELPENGQMTTETLNALGVIAVR